MLTDDELRAIVPCRECEGIGEQSIRPRGKGGQSMPATWKCPFCHGTGIDPERRERLEGLIRKRDDIAARYVLDRSQQYVDGSGSWSALADVAAALEAGEHITAHEHGELDDIDATLAKRERNLPRRDAAATIWEDGRMSGYEQAMGGNACKNPYEKGGLDA